jgi:hypothetical protein
MIIELIYRFKKVERKIDIAAIWNAYYHSWLHKYH